MTGARWRAAAGAASVVLLVACGGDAQPDSASESAPPDAGVTFPDTVPVPSGSIDPSAPSTSVDRELTVTAGAPRGFPDDFPRPDDADVVVGSSAVVGEDRVLALDLTTTEPATAVVASSRGAIEDAGFTLLLDAEDNLRFETDDYVGDILVTETPSGTSVVLTATLPLS